MKKRIQNFQNGFVGRIIEIKLGKNSRVDAKAAIVPALFARSESEAERCQWRRRDPPFRMQRGDH